MSKHSEAVAAANAKRGMFPSGLPDSPMVSRWNRMMKRCHDPKDSSYKFYGGRGIYVDSRWHSAQQFISDMGIPEDGMTLERIDNDGPYSKENCRRATRKEQGQNTRRTKIVLFQGEAMSTNELERRLGVSHRAIAYHLKIGKSIDEAIAHFTLKLESK